jgi:protein-S-isoprenylcysteine O-methyltransferase Ste14
VIFSVPTSITQIVAFWLLSIGFFVALFRAFSRRSAETGATRDSRSRLGIVVQSIGIATAGFGTVRGLLPPFGLPAILGTLAVIVLMGGSIALFAASSRELGRNWSLVARTRSDHELIRTGPYARVRHPIYLGMLLFLFGLAVALGHWVQLIVAVPVFLIGTSVRMRLEDGLLEQSFGDAFRSYRSSTPALIPRLLT